MGGERKSKSRPHVLIMYLIDTNIVIWLLRGKKKYVDIVQKLKYKSPLSISTVTIAEVYKNIFPSEILKTENILSEFAVWDVTTPIAKQAGLYWQEYNKKFKKLHILDCVIAGTAKENNLILLTLNIRHFPMKDIHTLDPVKEN